MSKLRRQNAGGLAAVIVLLIIAIAAFPAVAIGLVAIIPIGAAIWYLSTRQRIARSQFQGAPDFANIARTIANYYPHLHRYEGETPVDLMAVACTRKFNRIRAPADFLVISSISDANNLIITPATYWLTEGSDQATGSTAQIAIAPFAHDIKVDRLETDDRVLEETWLYTTKSGEPDHRRRNNPERYLVRRYGIVIQLENGLRWKFGELSRASCAALTAMMLVITGTPPTGEEQIERMLNDADQAFSESSVADADEADAHSKHHESPADLDPAESDAPWFQVLGVDREATVEEIKSAWRELIRQYHPDRGEGLAPEIQVIMASKTKALNRAYAEGMKLNS